MKIQILKVLFFIFIISFSISCDNYQKEYDKMIEKWKTDNDMYFTNMKDSTSYKLYTLPAEYGGGTFYYKIISKGDTTATSPLLTDDVTVNYKGMFIDGVTFDSTFSGTNPLDNPTAKPAEFSVNRLITGWTVNLTQMKPGEVRSVVLPYNLAYGIYGVGSILPYSTLKFTIHLISVKKK